MRFAIAKDIITPDISLPMGGYNSFHNKRFHGIHDDLYVKALMLDDGKERLLFITLDLLFHSYALTLSVKEYVREKHGIKPDCLFLSYTHTHGGPALNGFGDPNQYSEQYEQFLLQRIRSCVDKMMLNQSEGTLEHGCIEGDWNINRRKPVDGAIQLAPNPEGNKDNKLHLLKLVDTTGKIKSLLINYACHPVTTRDTLILSGDFPGRICQILDAEYYGSTTLFFQGAGGNLRPKVTAREGQFVTLTYEEVNEMSVAMAQRIRRAVVQAGVFRPIQPAFAALQFEIPLALDPFPKQHFVECLNDDANPAGIKATARQVLERYDQLPDEISLPGGIARLGRDVFIAFMGGEPCCEVKQNLESVFADKQLLFIGYADSTAYVPDDKLNREGGYEASGSTIEYGLKGPFSAGIDQRMDRVFRAALADGVFQASF